MKIGDLEIRGYAALAPMAGVADRAMRELCIGEGAAYCVGELTSAKALTLGDKKSAVYLSSSESEQPFGCQLFGCQPETMAKAAVIAQGYGPKFIDINMGCPAPKVAVAGGGGAALMRDPKLAGEIVRAVAQAVDVPVTVKIRTGWDEQHITAVEVARAAEENGACGRHGARPHAQTDVRPALRYRNHRAGEGRPFHPGDRKRGHCLGRGCGANV